jgi:hypothetical protein
VGVRHILRYLRGTLDHGLVLGGGKVPELLGYTHADWGANSAEHRSISGYSFLWGRGLVSWSSKRQPTPALSSTEAEYMALARGVKEALWLQRLFGALRGVTPGTVHMMVGNSSCIALAKNPEAHDHTKHIDCQYHFIRHFVAHKRVRPEHCPTEEMVADILTKPLRKVKRCWCVKAMGLTTKE